MKASIGLDFGTTNSALAKFEDGSVDIVNIDNVSPVGRTLRSVIYAEKKREFLVGQQAMNRYTEVGGRSCRFLQSIKAFLPDPGFTGTTLFGKRFEIEDLIALILTEIRNIYEQRGGKIIENVSLGRPVLFSENPENDRLAEERLIAAGRKAGFSRIKIEYEPIAAVLAYQRHVPIVNEEIVLMGDFGGGTSDFTVMRIDGKTPSTQEEKRKKILSMGGVYIGGDTFNSRIMLGKITPHFGSDVRSSDISGNQLNMPRWIMHELCNWHRIPFLRDNKTLDIIREIRRTTETPGPIDNLEYLIQNNLGFALFQKIERAKSELSSTTTTNIVYKDPHLNINQTLSRDEFESLISDDITRITECVTDSLSKAGVNSGGVDKILLTGGSSFIPAVRRIFVDMFGASKITLMDAFTSVAYGLALNASLNDT